MASQIESTHVGSKDDQPSDPPVRKTLGGLVSNCYIGGKIMKDRGDLDGDGIAVIPGQGSGAISFWKWSQTWYRDERYRCPCGAS